MFENSVYPGIVDALAELRDYGVQLFVATSKPRGFAERIVEHFELGRFFSNVYGSELSGANADKKDLLGHVLRAESLPPANTVMVGDRSYDILGARANSLFSVGVLWAMDQEKNLSRPEPARYAMRRTRWVVSRHLSIGQYLANDSFYRFLRE